MGLRTSGESFRMGIDTGGTFTDIVSFDEKTGHVNACKAMTTPSDRSVGVLNGIKKSGIAGNKLGTIIHGTTSGINAIITRKGAKIGLLYTDGFRDIMDMGRAWRPVSATVDPRWIRPHEERPIVPRYLRRPVYERVLADGTVLIPLDDSALKSLKKEVGYLVKEGVEAIAVCLLHSYKYPDHERKVKALIEKEFKNVKVDISSDICPYPKEYGRTCTTMLNSYIQPMISKYMMNLDVKLKKNGYPSQLLIATSQGGVTTSDVAKEKPVLTLGSGPIGGVIGAKYIANFLERPNIITLDMGGTSADVSIITRGESVTAREYKLEWDINVNLPVVEVDSIGAGGGSIAWLDPAGAINVGPQSAGSDPGPACYGKGGIEPTVTDAYSVLGILSPAYPLGGEITIAKAKAVNAMSRIGKPLKINAIKASHIVNKIANNNMTEAIRNMTMYRGLDPRDYTLLAFGAAGPIAASAIARELGVREVLVPSLAGAFSAFGLSLADMVFDHSEPVMRMVDELDPGSMIALYDNLAQRCVKELEKYNIPSDQVVINCAFEATYIGQAWELTAPLNLENMRTSQSPKAVIQEAFHATHHLLRGYRIDEMPIRFLVARVTAFGVLGGRRDVVFSRNVALSRTPKATEKREIHFETAGNVNVPCYFLPEIGGQTEVGGPAVLHDPNYTVLLQPGDVCKIDDYGNCWITF